MARLCEAYQLCPGKSIGARPGRDDNQVILSFELGSVQVYDVVSHSCISSWQLSSDQRLLCPVIYHNQSQSYWMIQGNRKTEGNLNALPPTHQELVRWGYREEMASGETRILLHSPFALLSGQTGQSPILVYRNGGVSVGGDRPHPPQPSPKMLFKSLLFHHGDVEYVSNVFRGDSGCGLSLWANNSEGIKQLSSSILRTNDSSISDCCVCGHVLVSLTTDGNLYKWNMLDSLASPSLSPTHKLSLLPPPIRPHLAGISDDYFALVGVVRKDMQLSLWDASYFTKQASSPLTSEPHTLCCVSNYVVLCCPEAVLTAVASMDQGCGTLVAALGKGQSSSGTHYCQSPVCDGAWAAQADQEQKKLIDLLTDVNKTSTLDVFMSHFKIIPEVDYSPVVSRLLGETEFWAREVFVQLLDSDLLPSSLVGEVLEAALEKRDWVLVSRVLERCCHCVPESTTVNLLEAVIKLPDVVDGGLTKEELMTALLSVPVNDSLLQQPLSQLPFSTVVLLLETLCCRVSFQQLLGSAHPHITYNSVLDWISILIDVHFIQLSLHDHTRHLIMKLQDSIFKQVKCLDQLSVVGAVQAAAKATPTSNNDWLYKIEKLPINI